MKNLYFVVSFFLSVMMVSFNYAVVYLPKDEELVQEFNNKKIRLFIMRNGEAVNNADDLTISWRSPTFHLTEEGKQIVQSKAQELLSFGIQAIYTSPQYRALNTTEIVESILGLPYKKTFVDEKLAQQDFGVFEGSTYQQFKAYFPSSDALYIKGAPEGESGKSVYARTRDLLWKIVASDETQVLIVTHAFNIAYINRLLTGDFGTFPKLGEYFIYDFSSP